MFEQELYNHEASQIKPQRGDLFYNYEIRNWNFTPRLYKILLVSALVNILGIVVFAQTNLLTMRGCESPFVGRVCEVLDTVYVTAVLFGTERDVIDAEYDKVDLGDAEITYIDVSGAEPQFDYPAGYFQVANPEQFSTVAENSDLFGANSGFSIPPPLPSVGSSDLINTVPKTPPANPNAVTGNIPDSPFSVEGDNPTTNSARKGRRGGRPVSPDTKPGEAVAENPTTNSNTNPDGSPIELTTDPVTGDEYNNRPLTDLGKFVSQKVEKGVDLQSEFLLSAKGRLNKDGKLDSKNFKYLKAESTNKDLIEIVQESIEAFNDSGRLKVLEKLSGKDLNLLVQQDNANITAVIQSELESESRARALQSSFDLLLAAAKRYKSGAEASQNDKDDLLILEGAKVEANGKNFVIRFLVPKEVVHNMIQRKLAKQKQEQSKPSGNALVKTNDNTAKK